MAQYIKCLTCKLEDWSLGLQQLHKSQEGNPSDREVEVERGFPEETD